MITGKTLLLLTGLALLSAAGLAGETWRASSGKLGNNMVELYTSEGCNSCPPAEAYLNNLKSHAGLWKTVFPLAFHVDYWNHLGWRDPYSKASHSARQRAYAREMNKLFVYTPQLLLNGKPWRPGFFRHALPVSETRHGSLDVELVNKRIRADFMPEEQSGNGYDLHVAIIGMGLHSSISAGENQGREAVHEFVVLASRQYRHASRVQDRHVWQGTLPRVQNRRKATQLGLVAWVSQDGSLAPLQVTGGLLP